MLKSALQVDPCPRQNQLLAALADAAGFRWQPQVEPVNLRVGQVLCESGSTPAYAYFPTTAIVSLVCTMLDGALTEVAVVGNEGMVGIPLVTGGNSVSSKAVVHSSGLAYRLRSPVLKNELARGGEVLRTLLRYTLAVIAQVAQTAACNRHHTIEQQLCRRLLLALDRSPSNELLMTQELASSLLGVRREGVTTVALRLQKAGAIRYSRGHITVLDCRRLEERACECYASARLEADRLMTLPSALVAESHAAAA